MCSDDDDDDGSSSDTNAGVLGSNGNENIGNSMNSSNTRVMFIDQLRNTPYKLYFACLVLLCRIFKFIFSLFEN